MNHERHLVVREARLGLTLLTCVLLALGYAIVHYLEDGGRAPTVEIRHRFVGEPRSAPDDAHGDEEQPQVLTIEGSDTPATVVHTSQLPEHPAANTGDAEDVGAAPLPQPTVPANLR